MEHVRHQPTSPSTSEAVPELAPAKANQRQEASNDVRECVDRVLHTDARVPVSTYRVQMHKDFNFGHAQAIVGYLKQLGIGDFYSSPIFEARPGSMHGYDVARHDRFNPELGRQRRLCQFLGGATAPGSWPAARHRAQPHGRW